MSPPLPPVPPAPDDHHLAATLAAGAMTMLVRERATWADQHLSPTLWGDRGDHLADEWLLERLAAARPDDAVLSEERADDNVRLGRSRVWIIDPLDGTAEFASPGRSDWAVHVALAVDGNPYVGAVALPDGTVYSTVAARPLAPLPSPGPLRIVVSRSRPPACSTAVAGELGARLVSLGSAGAKTAAVMAGDAEVYLHAGGMSQWDSCAPVAAALAAGLHASRLDGSPLRYNEADVSLPDLVVCRTEVAEAVLRSARRHCC